MTEAEQLAILEKIPGFTRPSVEWLEALESGDRVLLFILRDGRFVESGLTILEAKSAEEFGFRYRGALYTVEKSGNLSEGGGELSFWSYWISPV